MIDSKQIQQYGDGFTPAQRAQAVHTLREWFCFDTWTTDQALRLLVGIDPYDSRDLIFAGNGYESETNPNWARITQKPGIDLDGNGVPRVTGYCLDLFQIELISRLLNLWISSPGHTLKDRHPPTYFVDWAAAKGLPPFWLDWANDAGLFKPQNTAVPVAEPESVRYDLLATREALCAAFGVWGLSMKMFTNLTERQWLMDARKVKGQGQRGNRIEPLFCPLQVMQGLANKTKKPKLTESKGWDILENKFKAVFEEFQQFDPREQTG